MATSVPHLGKQLRPSGEHILASIDLGTNSLHMVIVRIDKSLPAFTIIAREKDTVRLGDCGPKGQLKPEVMDRAIATLKRFQELAKTFNVEQVVAVATSAVREAPNGRDFIKRVSDELDLEINLISGPEEARRIYLGVLSAMEFHDEPHVIIDIGGGSTELILGDGGEPKFLSSTKVGAVRLTQEYIKTDPISRTEFLFVQAYIRGMLERPVDELRLHLQPGKVPHLVGTSGTIETLAVMIAKEKLGTEPTPLAGYQITLNELHNIVSRLRKLSYQERLQIPGINDRRAEIILAGALILQEAMSLLEIESLTICERSLREGVIVDWMLTHGLIEDRLRYESSIRQRSILKIAQKYNVDLEHGERVAAFSLSLFDQTNGILHDYGSAERELLWAAAILHNCGLYISHSAHHKHSYYLIRNGELLGYTETEIDMIANLARYHRKSAPKKKHENYQNLSKKNRHIIDRLNPLMRLAVALDRRQIGAVAEVNCECDRDKKELKLILKPVDPQDNCALELWSLDLKKDVFEQQYNLKLAAFLEP
ncbi:MAG: Ppx/GppA phosphatase family protein [Limnospira sp. PMC 1291.21]|uniref:Ppx/GppA phosphatase family protein n=1 Tax=unclassified Limnospira TaxID=2642885 RepID=UPI0028E1600D|nr:MULTISPECIES: Ppx/GppA phosphatase family protein [unclassified Limnospira]MDT9249673.1 Ppx/GppA phosphatase family protein [Limnospira sp. PMC 1280.21]MDT9305713.1 Ppx/GppA phosphatase family protein [Limnospira sp. PMC 1291.21]